MNVGKNLASKIVPRENIIHSKRVGPSFRLFDTSDVEVSNLIHDLNPRKSNCVVDAPTNLIKCANYVVSPIPSRIFNYCVILMLSTQRLIYQYCLLRRYAYTYICAVYVCVSTDLISI